MKNKLLTVYYWMSFADDADMYVEVSERYVKIHDFKTNYVDEFTSEEVIAIWNEYSEEEAGRLSSLVWEDATVTTPWQPESNVQVSEKYSSDSRRVAIKYQENNKITVVVTWRTLVQVVKE